MAFTYTIGSAYLNYFYLPMVVFFLLKKTLECLDYSQIRQKVSNNRKWAAVVFLFWPILWIDLSISGNPVPLVSSLITCEPMPKLNFQNSLDAYHMWGDLSKGTLSRCIYFWVIAFFSQNSTIKYNWFASQKYHFIRK